MEISLNKEKLQTSEVLGVKLSQTILESDVIVPDVKPDIKKVVSVSGIVCVKQRVVQQDKVYVQGVVHMTVLYIPDGDVIGKIKSVTVSRDFNHSIDVNGVTPDIKLPIEAEAEDFDFTLINSRKINVRCKILVSVKAMRPVELMIATGTETEDVITKTDKILVCNSTPLYPCQVILREQLELPTGKPTIGEILRVNILPLGHEVQLLDKKAVVKGSVKVSVLYGAVDEDGSIQYLEYSLPFSEVYDMESAMEDMEGEVDYSIGDLYTEVREDSDGEARCIGVEVVLDASIKGSEAREVSVLTDAYSLSGDAEMVYDECNIEQLVDNLTAQIQHKDRVNIPEMMPPIAEVCDVNSTATVERISIEDGNIIVYGKASTEIIYLSDDENQPVVSFKHNSDFTHTFPCRDETDGCACDAKVWVEHMSYNLSGSDEMELRGIICVNIKVIKGGACRLVKDIEIADTPIDSRARVIIYFVQEGDSLWKIAKRYHTTVDKIKCLNGLESDKLLVGQQIKIA